MSHHTQVGDAKEGSAIFKQPLLQTQLDIKVKKYQKRFVCTHIAVITNMTYCFSQWRLQFCARQPIRGVSESSCRDLSAPRGPRLKEGGLHLFLLIRLPQRTTAALSRYYLQQTTYDHAEYTQSQSTSLCPPDTQGPRWLSPN